MGAVLVMRVGRYAEVPPDQARRAGLRVVRVDRHRRVAGVPWRGAVAVAVKARRLAWLLTPAVEPAETRIPASERTRKEHPR